MYNPAPSINGIPGTVRTPGVGGPGAAEHSSGAGYACQVSADRFHMAMAAHPSMVPQARQEARRALTTWRLAHIAADAELIVSELVTNAVRASSAGASVVALYMALDLDRLYVMVWDDCPRVPVRPAPAGDDSESGRGLGIVEMLSECCGTVIIERGKVVWSRISASVT